MTIEEKVDQLQKVMKEAEAHEETMRLNFGLAQTNTRYVREELKALLKEEK